MKHHAPKTRSSPYSQGMRMEYFTHTEPHAALYAAIVRKIHAQARHQAVVRMIVSLCVCVISVVTFIPASIWLYADVLRSGFAESFSLIFTDSSLVVTYWHDFGLLLLESLPVLSFAACLAIIAAIIISGKMLITYGHTMRQFAS